jgi:hypothetical protein
MKLEYRDLSSSRSERLKRPRGYSPGFLDFFAASLLVLVVSAYQVLPHQVERAVDHLVYDPSSNSYASFRCIRERTTQHQFTPSRDVPELRSSVRVVHRSALDRYAKPQPDAVCYAARGFVEPVSRFEFFFGWLLKAVS